MTNEGQPNAVTDKRAAMSALLDEAIQQMCDLGAEPWEIIHRLRAAEIGLRLKHWPVPGADPTFACLKSIAIEMDRDPPRQCADIL
jgi:hypothetical protein